MKINNIGYVWVMYDVKEKRTQKVFKECKKYLEHHQNSVFRGDITNARLLELSNSIKKVINRKEDKVTILKMRGDYVFEEEFLGVDEGFDMFL